MHTKGARTKAQIVAAAAPLFNERGFAGTSMNDILDATGLEKGGVYRHFASKDEIAIAAFDHAVKLLETRRLGALETHATALGRLYACVDLFRASIKSPVLRGGCPLLNTAIDADDTHAALRERARAAMQRWQTLLADLIDEARADGALVANVDAAALASIITAALEGAILTSRLLRDAQQLHRVVDHLHGVLRSFETRPRAMAAR